MEVTATSDVDEFVSEFCKEKNDIEGEYYFETDYLALKNNPDYLKLMKTLAILQLQRINVSQKIDKLEELRLRSKDDPSSVKEEILKNKAPYLFRCNIAEVPEIDWSKYKTFNDKNLSNSRRVTKIKRISESSNANVKKDEENNIKVRGRIYDEEKPENFNQLWTAEEQFRFEALLEEFPPEPIENQRWKKIAEALGTRSTQQVCSRAQKYFKKLRRAGVAPPTSKHLKSNRAKFVHRQNKHLLYKPTTFFPGRSMPELCDSDEDNTLNGDSAPISHWNEILNVIKEEKGNSDDVVYRVKHYGYKCEKCSETPIIGTRWECIQCPSVSMCSDCMVTLLDDPTHPLTHNFKQQKVFVNPSYSTMEFSTSNYLDPNFTS